jgi:hypothetical protein
MQSMAATRRQILFLLYFSLFFFIVVFFVVVLNGMANDRVWSRRSFAIPLRTTTKKTTIKKKREK